MNLLKNNKLSLRTILTLGLMTLSSSVLATSAPKPNIEVKPMISVSAQNTQNYQAKDATKMFPKPTNNMEQHILTLTKLTDEQNYRVEIEVGKIQKVDCNQHRLLGTINEQSLKGWGYTYYEVEYKGEGVSTRRACLNNTLEERFIPLQQPLLINYDSRLPKVFYLPEGFSLRYRIWQTDSNYHYTSVK